MGMDMERIIGDAESVQSIEFGRDFGLGFGRGGRNPNRKMKTKKVDEEAVVAQGSDLECDDLPCYSSSSNTPPTDRKGKKQEKKIKSDNGGEPSAEDKKSKNKGGRKGDKKEQTGSRKEMQKLTKEDERRLLSPLFDSFGAGEGGEPFNHVRR